MKIAVLCPGPSLTLFDERGPGGLYGREYDLLLGVNRAAEYWPCDWWVFMDAAAFDRDGSPSGRPRVLTSQQTFDQVVHREQLEAFDVMLTEQLAQSTTAPSVPGWKQFSMTAAMVLAEHLIGHGPALRKDAGSTQSSSVDLYGADWEGNLDWDGRGSPMHMREPWRWEREEHRFGHYADWLKRRGIATRRLTMKGVVSYG